MFLLLFNKWICQFVIFKPLSYCFEKAIGFEVKAPFASRPLSRLISWYNNQVIQQKNFDKRLFSSTALFMDWKLQTDVFKIYFKGYWIQPRGLTKLYLHLLVLIRIGNARRTVESVPRWQYWLRSDVFIANFEHISQIHTVFCCNNVDVEQVNIGQEARLYTFLRVSLSIQK